MVIDWVVILLERTELKILTIEITLILRFQLLEDELNVSRQTVHRFLAAPGNAGDPHQFLFQPCQTAGIAAAGAFHAHHHAQCGRALQRARVRGQECLLGGER